MPEFRSSAMHFYRQDYAENDSNIKKLSRWCGIPCSVKNFEWHSRGQGFDSPRLHHFSGLGASAWLSKPVGSHPSRSVLHTCVAATGRSPMANRRKGAGQWPAQVPKAGQKPVSRSVTHKTDLLKRTRDIERRQDRLDVPGDLANLIGPHCRVRFDCEWIVGLASNRTMVCGAGVAVPVSRCRCRGAGGRMPSPRSRPRRSQTKRACPQIPVTVPV